MNKREAIYVLYGLIADINADEIADHIKFENLRIWSNRWRNAAKNALRVFEETEPNCLEKSNNCETCGTPKHLCQYCIEEDRMWTPKDEPQHDYEPAEPFEWSEYIKDIEDESQKDCPKTCPSIDICTRDDTDCPWRKEE